MVTTKKHFEIFRKECQKWVKIFNLSNWQVYYEHKVIEGDAECYARLNANLYGYVALIQLNKCWKGVPTNKGLKKSARHEIVHLLLARLGELAKSRYISGTELIEAEEEVVNRLVKYLGSR